VTEARTTLWTVGHSTQTLEQLIDLLRAYEISLLVDVRTVPRSRRNPQFNRESLPEDLEPVDIAYRHEKGLGGLRKPRKDSTNLGWQNPGFRGYADYMETDEFELGIDALIEMATDSRVAVMCAEAVPWRCHRSLIADALTARGIDVVHVLPGMRAQPHHMTPFASVMDGRVTYPGLQ
jgi:uncharacterized protein (DUF488 family)